MDEAERRSRAYDARRLLSEPLLKEAIDLVIDDAKNALVTVDASNMAEVMRLQAGAVAASHLEEVLHRVILAGPPEETDRNNDPGVT